LFPKQKGGKMAPVYFSIESGGNVIAYYPNRSTFMDFGKVNISQIMEGQRRREQGAMIQDALPFLNADQREFLLSGLTPEMWDELFENAKL
jgi:hypothetical protein